MSDASMGGECRGAPPPNWLQSLRNRHELVSEVRGAARPKTNLVHFVAVRTPTAIMIQVQC